MNSVRGQFRAHAKAATPNRGGGGLLRRRSSGRAWEIGVSIFRAAFSILIICGTLFAVLGKAGAAEFNVEFAGMAPQTSSTIPVNDDRVARIETRGIDAETGNLGETLNISFDGVHW